MVKIKEQISQSQYQRVNKIIKTKILTVIKIMIMLKINMGMNISINNKINKSKKIYQNLQILNKSNKINNKMMNTEINSIKMTITIKVVKNNKFCLQNNLKNKNLKKYKKSKDHFNKFLNKQ